MDFNSSRRDKKSRLNFRKLIKLNRFKNRKTVPSYSETKFSISSKKLKTILKLLIAANFLVISAIAILVYLNTENNRTFNRHIYEIDSSLKACDYDNAQKIIKTSVEYSSSRNKALMLLKRELFLSEKISDYVQFGNISEYFYKKYKRDIRIKKIYLYSLIKNKNTEQFFKHINTKSLDDSFLNDLIVEGLSLYLENNEQYKLNDKIFNNAADNNLYINLLFNQENPEIYLKIYEQEKNKKYLNNLILLETMKGNMKDAFKYDLIRKKQDFLSVLINLDMRNYLTSLNIFKEINDHSSYHNMILADIKMYLKQYNDSKAVYNIINSNDPFFSNKAILNILWIEYSRTGILNTSLLDNLINNYPDENIENILFFINLGIIASEIPEISSTSDINLIEKLLQCNKENSDNYLNILWSIYNNYNISDDFNNYLALYLFEKNNYTDLEILINKDDFKNTTSFYLFNFLINIKNNIFEDAENNLNEYIDKNESWEILYNLSLLDISRNRFISSIQYLDLIISKMQKTKNIKNSNLSMIYFWKAYSLYKIGRYNDSYTVLNKSISINRGNIESKILMKHIKSKIVES